ncbi:hypothetical protein CL629_02840 [bacterium]|nr:hypothetical protein [bacterium]
MQDKRGDPPELLDVDYSTPIPLSDHERMRRMKEYDEIFEMKLSRTRQRAKRLNGRILKDHNKGKNMKRIIMDASNKVKHQTDNEEKPKFRGEEWGQRIKPQGEDNLKKERPHLFDETQAHGPHTMNSNELGQSTTNAAPVAKKAKNKMCYQDLEQRLQESLSDHKLASREWIAQTTLINKVLRLNKFIQDFYTQPDYAEILEIIRDTDERSKVINDMKFDYFRELGDGKSDGHTLGLCMQAWRNSEPGDDIYCPLKEAVEEIEADKQRAFERHPRGAIGMVWKALFAMKDLDEWEWEQDFPYEEKKPYIPMHIHAASLSVLASNQ